MEENTNKKPKVFPTPDIIAAANETGSLIAKQINNENEVVKVELGAGELAAAEEMNKKTEAQINTRNEKLAEAAKIADPVLRQKAIADAYDSTKEVRPELAVDYGVKYEVDYGEVTKKQPIKYDLPKNKVIKPPVAKYSEDSYIESLSENQHNAPYDVIPLPSKGKLYPNGKPTLKVAYLNASDENILTNPNLLESGKFLEVLINRKLMDTPLKYRDLHIGDRNAIMIWLRSTGYGPEYPISLFDPNTGTQFETEIDLSMLKMIELEVDTDEYGHIPFELPSKNFITFKLLSVGDLDDIEEHVQSIIDEKGPEFSDSATFTLKKQIQSVNGVYDKDVVSNFVDTMRMNDLTKFRKYVSEVESGMDMHLTVRTPGGESIKTFLPLNISFFWPNL